MAKKYDDMAKALGDDKSPGADTMGDDEDTNEPDLPPEFVTAAEEAFPDLKGDDARLQAFYDAIESCKGSGHGGLAIMIGGKPKGSK